MVIENEMNQHDMELVRLNARHPYATRIGAGAGAEIYLAMQQGDDQTFQRLAAVKKVAALSDGSGRNELLREIRAAAGLSHPNIVRIYGVEKSGARLLVSMEYVYGHRLSTLLASMRQRGLHFPVPILLRMLFEACEGLHHAHSAVGLNGEPLSLVHRDMCPDNIMLDVHGYLRIVDFGLAKIADSEDTTIPGRVKGRFLYMPLEQMRGQPLDARTDIFSLAMTFYELATLQSPRRARNIKEAYDEALGDPRVDVVSTLWDGPPEVDALFSKATSADPKERYQTAREFSAEIERVARTQGGIASVSTTEAWLNRFFGDYRRRRESFEQAFAAAVEAAQKSSAEVRPPPVVLAPDVSIIKELEESESTTRWLVALLVGVALVAAVGLYQYATRERSSVAVSQGFQIETSGDEAAVYVLSIPAGSTLFVDDIRVGDMTRLGMTVSLKPGDKHVLRLELSGYKSFTVNIEGQVGVTDQVIAQLELLPTKKPRKRRRHAQPNRRVEDAVVDEPQSYAESESPQFAEPQQEQSPSAELESPLPIAPEIVSTPSPKGLHNVRWGMQAVEVERMMGAKPERRHNRVHSFSGSLFKNKTIESFVYLENGLGAIVYLVPQKNLAEAKTAFESIFRNLRTTLGEPSSEERSDGEESRIQWRNSEADIILVFNPKKPLNQAVKLMQLSMPWVDLQRELGHLPKK